MALQVDELIYKIFGNPKSYIQKFYNNSKLLEYVKFTINPISNELCISSLAQTALTNNIYSISDDEDNMPEENISIKYHAHARDMIYDYYKNKKFIIQNLILSLIYLKLIYVIVISASLILMILKIKTFINILN